MLNMNILIEIDDFDPSCDPTIEILSYFDEVWR